MEKVFNILFPMQMLFQNCNAIDIRKFFSLFLLKK